MSTKMPSEYQSQPLPRRLMISIRMRMGRRRAPAMQTAHQSQVALLDITQHGPGYGHAQTSAGRLASDSSDSAHGLCEALTRALQRRANSASSRNVARVTTGTSMASGLKRSIQGRS